MAALGCSLAFTEIRLPRNRSVQNPSPVRPINALTVPANTRQKYLYEPNRALLIPYLGIVRLRDNESVRLNRNAVLGQVLGKTQVLIRFLVVTEGTKVQLASKEIKL